MPNSQPQRPIRDELVKKSKNTFVLFLIIAVCAVVQMVRLQTVKKKEVINRTAGRIFETKAIPATRGNILARDGRSLLATSIPRYRVALDPTVASKEYFDDNIKELSIQLATYFKDKTSKEYETLIREKRKEKNSYVRLGNRDIDHEERDIIQTFAFFKDDRLKAGGIFEKKEERILPFVDMASRTIGRLDRKTNTRGEYGIEYSFNQYLAGKEGKGVFQKITGGVWKPVDPTQDTKPISGLDVVSTIDVNFQDIVETALRKQVIQKNAKYGSAILMEIETGEIRAISNLSRRGTEGNYRYLEDENYAIRGGTAPGSTFKVATMAALLEKAPLNPDDFAAECTGQIRHYGLDFKCSHKHGRQTVQQVIENSCNIGIYRLVQKHFGFSRADDYVAYLNQFRLDQPLGFQLKGESEPIIKNKRSESFSHTTIPWMSIGYETRLSPLQMLTFYNAIANKGHWVQPILVKEIRDVNEVIQRFEPNKIPKPIVSERTAQLLTQMMIGVVENGTAAGIKEGYCRVGGKTGTSQKRINRGYREGIYYTAFIGFFPADNPKYSCAIIIDEPMGSNIYAADVCAPVFRDIADRMYAIDIALHTPKNKIKEKPKVSKHLLRSGNLVGHSSDFRIIAEELDVAVDAPLETGIIRSKIQAGKVDWVPLELTNDLPNLIGITLRDAIPVLESRNYVVTFDGIGRVVSYQKIGNRRVHLQLKP